MNSILFHHNKLCYCLNKSNSFDTLASASIFSLFPYFLRCKKSSFPQFPFFLIIGTRTSLPHLRGGKREVRGGIHNPFSVIRIPLSVLRLPLLFQIFHCNFYECGTSVNHCVFIHIKFRMMMWLRKLLIFTPGAKSQEDRWDFP